MRHTTFRYTLNPTPEQAQAFARHAGAARYAYNQCLALVREASDRKHVDPEIQVPWSAYALINAFNAWKRSEAAGRRFVVGPEGMADLQVTGLWWREQVVAQVFEEAAVDLSRALAAFWESRSGMRKGPRVGFPKWRKKGCSRESFRVRNRTSPHGTGCIRVGEGKTRSVRLPKIGVICVVEDTRRLRRLLRPIATGQADPKTGEPVLEPRARILFATIGRRGIRWQISITVEASDLHPALRHATRPPDDHDGWVGVDRGLSSLAVAATADRVEVGRWPAPKSLQRSLHRLRSMSRSISRKKLGSANRAKVIRRLSRYHTHIANQRRHYLHEVSTQLVKTHDRLVMEDLHVAGMVLNRHLARSIADAGWAELSGQVAYKQSWRGGQLLVADRWFPSSKTCSSCGWHNQHLGLGQRIFVCGRCRLVVDRDLNAAANLAAWASAASRAGATQVPDRRAGGRVIKACGEASAGHPVTDGETHFVVPSMSDAGKEAGTDTRVLVDVR